MGEDPATITCRVSYANIDRMGMVDYANYMIDFELFRDELLRRR